MADLLTNGGFEAGSVGWSGWDFISPGHPWGWLVGTGVAANEGTQYALGIFNVNGTPDAYSDLVSDTFAVRPGRAHALRGWARSDFTEDIGELVIAFDDGSGWVDLARWDEPTYSDPPEPVSPYRQKAAIFVPTATPCQIRLRVPQYHPSARGWYADSLRVDMLTNTLREALKSDLEDIDGTGIFQTTLTMAGDRIEHAVHAETPAVLLDRGEGGSAEGISSDLSRNAAEQQFSLRLMVRSDQADSAVDQLLDDVRNAVERPTGNLITETGVDDAVVSAWSRVTAATDVSPEWGEFEATVTVRYTYSPGGL